MSGVIECLKVGRGLRSRRERDFVYAARTESTPYLRATLLCVLFIFSSAALISAEPSARFVITDHGAIGDGVALNTKTIQSTIDACAAQGGGVVVVPAGTFLTGSIFFKQGVNLLLEKDGVLKGTTNQDDFPQIPTRWEGVEREWTAAMVNFIDMKNVEVSGDGTLDGSGELWVQRFPRRRPNAQATEPSAATPPANETAPPQRRFGRPRLIGFTRCANVRVANINLKNEASWGLFVLYSEDVVIDGLMIRAEHNIPSSDGIDIDSSRRVRIANCDIDVNDDCISIKSGKDEDGLRVNRPSEDIIVEKTHFRYGHGGVAMGSETSGGIRNVEVRECVFDSDNWAPIRFKSQPSRGGVVENITYRDLVLRDTRQMVEFNLEWRMVPPIAPPAKVLPLVRNIRIINVTGTTRSVGMIRGLAGSPIDGVKFESCTITAQRGLVLDHAINVDLAGLQVTGVEGEVVRRGSPDASNDSETSNPTDK